MYNGVPKEVYFGIYESLKGTRRNKMGELIIDGFRDEDYEDVVAQIIVLLKPVIKDDFNSFVAKIHHEYLRWYSKQRVSIVGIRPRYDEIPNVRQLLSLLKYYVYRRVHSNY